ncbi:ligase-associated DNA damage response endonuclease PdeM [Halioxenophilus aromaticivorans]|uniref:Ligase-associated DNA damage response endonuclease PdeM n=1 Tax=Halioxenophilus aromaticivorans TaxID=1306992 RepID=A0AAV3TZ15_9ALTE
MPQRNANHCALTQLKINQHSFYLLPERALYWPAQNALIIADLHLGKVQTFQLAGIAVPCGVMEEDLQRLSRLIANYNAQQVIVLGDFTHHTSGLSPPVQSTLTAWLAQHKEVTVRVILGNHDRPSIAALQQFNIDLIQHSLTVDQMTLVHEFNANEQVVNKSNSNEEQHSQFSLCGHIHPVVRIPKSNLGNIPVFAIYQQHAVLPAFSLFTGGHRIEIKKTKAVYAIAGQHIVNLK